MKSIFAIVLCLYSLFAEVEVEPGRANQLKYLHSEYAAALEVHRGIEHLDPTSTRASTQSDVATLYLPKYLEIAEASPEDDVAFEAYRWIITHGSKQRLQQEAWHEADKACWRMIAKHHCFHPELATLVLSAGQKPSAVREEFLENLPNDWTQTVEVHGHALLGLAELRIRKYEWLLEHSSGTPSDSEASEEWIAYMNGNKLEHHRAEIRGLFRDVLDHYSSIDISGHSDGTTNFLTLGERAQAGLEKFNRAERDRSTAPLAGAAAKEKSLVRNSNGG
jgi:hypothetical protein